jgi:hypothetical protein
MSRVNNHTRIQAGYGDSPYISTVEAGYTRIVHRTHFAEYCIDGCDGDKDRQYFYINENSLEYNEPSSCSIYCPGIPFVTGQNLLGCYQVCSVPPNCCCPGADNIKKEYFDRGVFSRQNFCYTTGCVSGLPTMFPNEVQYMCCCCETPTACNQCLACYWPSLCGERVRYLPFENYCYCCPSRANACSNCCGLIGPKDGEPVSWCLIPIRTGLADGEAQSFCDAYEAAYLDWGENTGYLVDQDMAVEMVENYKKPVHNRY